MSEEREPSSEEGFEPTEAGGRDEATADATSPVTEAGTPELEEELEPASPETVAATGKEFLEGLLRTLGLEAEIETSVEGTGAAIDVTGESLGILIGRRGQTLDALQELTRTAVQRRLRSRVRLLVDVEGYRARRRASLADYARAIAERAKDRGTEIELEP
ncbi:MAG: KH domain-containing protein, partial [Actinomycetota bacterium]|nr:KH domain-containing protein [Actinomycetota bacterium]